jgi:uroporphyrinogen decarboxylase
MKIQNDILLRTIEGEEVERPPVWLMRQAGRILPQYRALRASLSSFKELVSRPDLAAEVTIQPVDELDVDAAIIFSDILVIPEAMGLDYEMVKGKGPVFPQVIESAADIERLKTGEAAAERLQYVYEAVKETNKRLDGRVPLIGFSGAPWTLLAYMLEGQGSKTFSKAKKFLYQEPSLAHLLLEKLTEAIVAYLKEKIRSGVHVVQLFDSWAGLLTPWQYREFSLPYINAICEAVEEVPVTVFAKGAWFILEDLKDTPCQTIGLDWNTSVAYARQQLGREKILQGNLDPCQLYAPVEKIEAQTLDMIRSFSSRHIVNLGHGVYPDTPLDGVKAFVNTVKTFKY